MIAYLFQMIVCSGFLYAYYHFLLRNEKFHRYNRFFLISIIIISLVLPLVKIPVTVPSDNSNIVYQSLEEWNSSVTIATQKSPQWFSAAGILQVCYAVVALFFIIRIVIGIQKIIHLKKKTILQNKRMVSVLSTPPTLIRHFLFSGGCSGTVVLNCKVIKGNKFSATKCITSKKNTVGISFSVK